MSWIKIGLGVLLLLVGIRQWRGRGGQLDNPKWIAAIDEFTFVKSLGLGVLLSAVNRKNLIMSIGAGVAIGSAALSVGNDVVAIVVFTAIAASTMAIPVIAYAVAAEKIRGPLDVLRAWLQANNATVMATLILVIRTVLIGKGISGL